MKSEEPFMKENEKERLDVLLVEKGLFSSRERAKREINAGNVTVDGVTITKAGTMVKRQAEFLMIGTELRYVSRGGQKLEKALHEFSIELAGKVCMDIGASTGGFTDCMLQNGAKRVYAVDVGTDQLCESLKRDERVISKEQTNIRYALPEDFPEQADFVSIDVSFISLKKVLFPVHGLMKDGAFLCALIKPQFEAGKGKVGKKGVVHDEKLQKEILSETISFAGSVGFTFLGLCFSPICGPEGNIEFLLYLRKENGGIVDVSDDFLTETVQKAHQILE